MLTCAQHTDNQINFSFKGLCHYIHRLQEYHILSELILSDKELHLHLS